MNIYWKIGSYLIAIAAAFALVNWYGSSQYNKGYEQYRLEAEAAAAKLSEEYRQKELEAQRTAYEELAKANEEKAKTEAARNRLANLYSSLQHDYEAYKRSVSAIADDPERATRAIAAGISNLESCSQSYKSMAEEYAGFSDNHNALIAQCKIGRK